MRRVLVLALLAVFAAALGCGRSGDSKAKERDKTAETSDAGAPDAGAADDTTPDADTDPLPTIDLDDGPDIEVPALIRE